MNGFNPQDAQRLMDLFVLRMIHAEPASETSLTQRLVALPKGAGRTALATSLRRLTAAAFIRAEGHGEFALYFATPAGEHELAMEQARKAEKAADFNQHGLDGSFQKFLGTN